MKKVFITLTILLTLTVSAGFARSRLVSPGSAPVTHPSDTGASLEDTLQIARPSDTGGAYRPAKAA